VSGREPEEGAPGAHAGAAGGVAASRRARGGCAELRRAAAGAGRAVSRVLAGAQERREPSIVAWLIQSGAGEGGDHHTAPRPPRAPAASCCTSEAKSSYSL
jgi:hypothetical protein